MTSVAANIVSNTSSTASGAAPVATASGDDGFAALLGDVLQTATPSNDADAPANDAAVTAAAAQTPTTTQTPDASTLFLQEVASAAPAASHTSLGDAVTSDPSSGNNDEDDIATDLAAGKPDSRSTNASNGATRPDIRRGAHSEPLRLPANAIATADAGDGSPPATASDPTMAQLLAAQQAVPAPGAANVSTISSSDEASNDAATPAIDPAKLPAAPATDVAANGVLAGGATVKLGKTDARDDTTPASDEKSQKQATTAAAVADLGKAASRTFIDERASAAHALSVRDTADQPKNGSQSSGSPSGNPNTALPNTAAPAPAAEAPTANAFAPAHAQPQPDVSAAANTASATPAPAGPAAASAPVAPIASQLQIAHPPAQPDINALAFNIASKSEGGARHFDIRLDPAELGRVDVRLTVDHNGQAQATLSVEKPQTLELLQKDQSHLERALKDAGLDLTQNGLSFSLKGQQQQNAGAGNDSSPRGRQLAVRAIAAAGETASQLSFGGVASSDSRLDIRV